MKPDTKTVYRRRTNQSASTTARRPESNRSRVQFHRISGTSVSMNSGDSASRGAANGAAFPQSEPTVLTVSSGSPDITTAVKRIDGRPR
jgi:hypothetical protein